MATIDGTNGNDSLFGTIGNDSISGLLGDDTIVGSLGNDTLDGGDDIDLLNYSAQTAGIVVDLYDGIATGSGIGTDSVTSFEKVQGGAGDDSLRSALGVDTTLMGGDGNDTFLSSTGDDHFDGGDGFDVLDLSITGLGVSVDLGDGTMSGGGVVYGNDTFTNIEAVIGGSGQDVFSAASGNGYLDGGGGNDWLVADLFGVTTMVGGSGNDTIWGSGFNDLADYSSDTAGILVNLSDGTVTGALVGTDTIQNIGTILGGSGDDTLLSSLGSTTLDGGEGNDRLVGSSFGDSLIGGAGNDTIIGSAGRDTLDGGSGDSDLLDYSAFTSKIKIDLAANEVVHDSLVSSAQNFEEAIAGDGNDTLIGGSNTKTLVGGDGNDRLESEHQSVSLSGGADRDTFVIGGGANTIDGGDGNDSVFYTGDRGLTFDLAAGTVSGNHMLSDTLLSIEVFGGIDGDDYFLDSSGNDSIGGGLGSDTFVAGAGDDTFSGGTFFGDTVDADVVDYSSDTAGIVLSRGSTVTGASVGTDILSSIEVYIGGSGNDSLEGLSGSDKNETFVGGAGDDTLEGHGGVDTFKFNSLDDLSLNGDRIVDWEDVGNVIARQETMDLADIQGLHFIYEDAFSNRAGEFRYEFSAGETLIYFDIDGDTTADRLIRIENGEFHLRETFVGSQLLETDDLFGDDFFETFEQFGDTLEGGRGNDTLIGWDGNDTLNGGLGADSLIGGSGLDLVSFEGGSPGLVAILSEQYKIYNSGDAANDTYSQIEGIIGTAHDDFLVGDDNLNGLVGGDGNDTLMGLGGVDYLIGGSGDDTLNGGAGSEDWLFGDGGSDWASYRVLSGAVTASLDRPGTNTGQADGDRYFSIENLEGSYQSDRLTGDDNANILRGLFGRDTLDGGRGNDTLDGGAQKDVLIGNFGFDYASYESSGSGVVAILLSQYSNYNTGDAIGDTYNSIEGLIGSSKDDGLAGDNGANRIFGGDGNDLLLGVGGDDTLDGGEGNDTLNGGALPAPSGFGNDTFVFKTGYDADTIDGFAAGAGSEDVIALSLGTNFDEFSEIQGAASDVGGNTLLTFTGGDSLTLIGVTSASLHQDDFLFV